MEELAMTGSPDALHGYHVHIYYNDDTRPVAEKLRNTLASGFPVQIGKNVGIAGPHPVPQIQIIFRKEALVDAEPRRARHPGASAERR
jgi:aromatic ring-cleaving dioxygenase